MLTQPMRYFTIHIKPSKMKVRFWTFTAFFLISVTVLTMSCNEEVIYPVVPAIKYKGFTIEKSVSGKDSALKLTITYTDGDGDLGLRQSDTNTPFAGIYYYNLYIDYYELIGGKWQQVARSTFDTNTIRFRYRFPYLSSNSDNKALRGEIENSFDLPSRDKITTIKLKFYIYDRKLHKSNVDSSGIITYF
jgi:hypothetical protein